jgi:glyoxylase I family protein
MNLHSIMVEDQEKALEFYTAVLGFEKKQDIPAGQYQWLTVISPESPDVELSLEPNANPAARTYQEAMFARGIPLAAFEVSDMAAEVARLKERKVAFTQERPG